jgi:hypothetical protein
MVLEDPGRRTDVAFGEMPLKQNGRVVLSPARRTRDVGAAAISGDRM